MRLIQSRINNGILLVCLTLAAGVAANFNASECEKTKVCVGHPVNCYKGPIDGCEYAFSYEVAEESPRCYVMEMYTRRPDSRVNYVAVGFSDDPIMGNDIVVHCASVNGEPVEVHLSQNPGKSNKPAGPDVDKAALSLAASESNENHMYCKFSLTYDASVQDSLPDPATQYHLLFARGPARTPDRISIHSTDFGGPDFPVSSDFKVDLLRQPRPAASSAAESSTSAQDVAAPTTSSGDPEGDHNDHHGHIHDHHHHLPNKREDQAEIFGRLVTRFLQDLPPQKFDDAKFRLEMTMYSIKTGKELQFDPMPQGERIHLGRHPRLART
ncbi:ferric-chelate reductase 1-like protein [Aphelenchoides avenae]|nr:ferric-chelate reductase 1-like protein [Aphelenchus avenae]